jgi:hypothetical protein
MLFHGKTLSPYVGRRVLPGFFLLTVSLLVLRPPAASAQGDPDLDVNHIPNRHARELTGRELLHRGLTSFEGIWKGNYREGILLYEQVAKIFTNRIRKHRTAATRRTVYRLERALQILDDALYEPCYDMAGGTAVHADNLRMQATRQEFLFRLLLSPPHKPRSDRSARRSLRIALAQLETRLQHAMSEKSGYQDPTWQTRHKRNLRTLHARIQDFKRRTLSLPAAYAPSIAARLQGELWMFDKWVVEGSGRYPDKYTPDAASLRR